MSEYDTANEHKLCFQIGKLKRRIAELEGIIKSDDERLTEAGLKVNLYFGCDTAEIMAEEILSSRARIAELEAAQRWIPVSERLPELEDGDSKDYDVVLTYPFRRDVIVATWSYDALDKTHRRRWFDCSSDEWGSDDITEYVTHWRERPTPPEVQE